MLLNRTGKPLIQHTYEAASQSKLATGVSVATDSQEIFNTVMAFGGIVVRTSNNHSCGTSRVAEAVRPMTEEVIVNVQGDEVGITGEAIDALILGFLAGDSPVATLATRVTRDSALDHSAVKVVFDRYGHALYFSRSMIPSVGHVYKHLGVYIYKRDYLQEFDRLPFSRLEVAENLEQLRILYAGQSILVIKVEIDPISINTPEDYEEFVRRQDASRDISSLL